MARISDWMAAVVGMGKNPCSVILYGGVVGMGQSIVVGIPGLKSETWGTQRGVESGFYA
jgi:hypothetical protein